MTILAVTGMRREARAISGPGILTAMAGGHEASLRETIARTLSADVRGIISIGIAGGLAPLLKAGDAVVASDIVAAHEHYKPDARWTERLRARLPDAHLAAIAGTGTIVATALEKAALFRSSGAFAIDMESHIVAEIATRHGLPFAAVRVIADRAEFDLPPLATVALNPQGRVNFVTVGRSLAASPAQIPALVRTARHTNTAFAALLRCRRVLGFRLAFPDGG